MPDEIVVSGRCRVCGCTELQPCLLEDELPCAWLDLERTLCTNPRCVGQVPIAVLEKLHLSPAWS